MTPESKLSGAHSHEHNWYNNQCQSPTNSWFFLTGIPVVKSPYVCPFSLHVSSKKSIKFHQFPICLKLDSPFVSWENYDSKLTFALVSLTFHSSKLIFSFFPLNTQHSTFPNWNVHLFSRKSAPLFQRWHPQNLATAKALKCGPGGKLVLRHPHHHRGGEGSLLATLRTWGLSELEMQ